MNGPQYGPYQLRQYLARFGYMLAQDNFNIDHFSYVAKVHRLKREAIKLDVFAYSNCNENTISAI